MPKITRSCKKVLDRLEKNRPKLSKQVSKKLIEFHINKQGKNGLLSSSGKNNVFKLYLTTPFGAFRLIVIDNVLVDIVLIDIYFKGDKQDLTQIEYKNLKLILLNAESDNFWLELEEI